MNKLIINTLVNEPIRRHFACLWLGVLASMLIAFCLPKKTFANSAITEKKVETSAAEKVVLSSVAKVSSISSMTPSQVPLSTKSKTSGKAAKVSVDPVDVWLDKIEKRSQTIRSFQAKLTFKQIQVLQGDEQIRYGNLYYLCKPKPIRFAIHFHSVVIDGKLKVQPRAWIFDGQWLVERLDDQKQFFKRQITQNKPSENSKSLDFTRSPFPIPLQIKADEIRSRFKVSLIAADKKIDPPHTFHLRLTPRKQSRFNWTRIDLWYGLKTHLPVRAHTTNDDTGDELIYSLRESIVNKPIAADKIDTRTPTGHDWHVEITPWKPPVKH